MNEMKCDVTFCLFYCSTYYYFAGLSISDRSGEPSAQHVSAGADSANVLQHQIAFQVASRFLSAPIGGADAIVGNGTTGL